VYIVIVITLHNITLSTILTAHVFIVSDRGITIIIVIIQGVPKKLDHFKMCITSVYVDVGRCLVYQNVRPFTRSKIGILHVAMLEYSCISSEKQYYNGNTN